MIRSINLTSIEGKEPGKRIKRQKVNPKGGYNIVELKMLLSDKSEPLFRV
ncbi:hypothetical protein PIL02S_00490 [Paenibacillus illinoisensis]|uniref:Uncharacterized protein n=1 Tax=Paenibacillus illinoisensis TaxID=59845 RepID=A0A2W0CD95_9BACL|nr:hypothetical protein PIL02S_00490 [Paenibacillus illinoisensis]